jgi:hypothetical protein
MYPIKFAINAMKKVRKIIDVKIMCRCANMRMCR